MILKQFLKNISLLKQQKLPKEIIEGKNQMETKLQKIIGSVLNIGQDVITEESGMYKTKNWDSINALNIIFEVEKVFGTRFEVKDYEKLTSFRGLYLALIKNHN